MIMYLLRQVYQIRLSRLDSHVRSKGQLDAVMGHIRNGSGIIVKSLAPTFLQNPFERIYGVMALIKVRYHMGFVMNRTLVMNRDVCIDIAVCLSVAIVDKYKSMPLFLGFPSLMGDYYFVSSRLLNSCFIYRNNQQISFEAL